MLGFMDRDGVAASSDPFVALADRAVRTYVTDRRVIDPPTPPPSEMAGSAGVFVSIKKHGALRGCIGTFFPTEETIAAEVVANAIKSATSDPRFPPIGADELCDLTLSVDVLSEPEPCTEADLDPSRYGVIVESGWRRGLLLPDLVGVESVAQQIGIARRKAGIGADERVELRRFTVERHT
jgi:AmmeMemoRadiSam system protein A